MTLLHPTTLRRRRAVAVAAAVAVVLLALRVAAPADANPLPPPGPWPAPVVGATNPLVGSAFTDNGGHASAQASLRVWLPSGRHRRAAITRTIGRRTVVRGRLRDRISRRSISGATVQLAAQNVEGGEWYLAGVARTNRKGRFRALLPAGATRRVAVLYWPFASSLEPLYSRRLLVRASPRVSLAITARGRSALFRGGVGGDVIPPGGLVVAAQVRNGDAWVSVRLVRTDANGRFRARYRFKYRDRRFVVRATVPSQPGWRLYTGSSRRHSIRTR
jgi:hypothetical protein